MVSDGPGDTVMGHQREKHQAQDTTLGGDIVSHMHTLRSVGEEVKEPVTQGGGETEGTSLLTRFAHQS